MNRARYRTCSTLIFATFFLSAMAFGAGLLLKKTVLVMSDESCGEIKGKVTGHRNVKYQDPNTGTWTDYTMTACTITVADQARVSSPSVSTNLAGLSETTTFSKVVETAGMSDTLDKEKAVTVFAPSNAAMKKMSPRLMDKLMSDRTAAREFVLRHCVLGKRFALDGEMIKNTAKLGDEMTGGDRIVRRVTFESNRPHVAESSIVIADLDTDNGVIHVIDSILRDK
jgi:uncharacterized surface protein with fasciclin (FAS1) repeats